MTDEPDDAGYFTPWRIVAVVALMVFILAMTGFLTLRHFSLRVSRDRAREAICKHGLNGIGLAADMYSIDFGGYWPYSEGGELASVSLLFDQYLGPRPGFVCPSTRDNASTVTAGAVLKRHQCSYTYRPGQLGIPLGSGAPDDLVVAYDRTAIHYRGGTFSKQVGRNVLYSNGVVEFLLEPQFQQRLSQDLARYRQYEAGGQSQ